MTKKKILITGGAGFIGCNAVTTFARKGWDVVVLDNLSRPGARHNLKWLLDQSDFRFYETDVRDARKLEDIVKAENPGRLSISLVK